MTLMTRLCGEGDMASVSQTPVYSNCPRLPSLNFPTFTRETVTVTSNLSYIPHRLLYYWQPDPPIGQDRATIIIIIIITRIFRSLSPRLRGGREIAARARDFRRRASVRSGKFCEARGATD